MGVSDRLSFLPLRRKVEFEGGKLVPLDTFDEACTWIQGRLHSDGFVYPPQIPPERWHAGSADAISTPGTVKWDREALAPRTALVHQLPASHEISISCSPLEDDFRHSDGAFLLHLAAYLYGIRLQFHDFWFDGRVRVVSSHHAFIRVDAEHDFISHAYAEWRTWPKMERDLLKNSLYMHARAPTHEWDWDRFNVNYIVFDSLYRLAAYRQQVKQCSHRERLYAMCEAFGLSREGPNLTRIYELRNPLIHEGDWAGQQPGTAIEPDDWRQVQNLYKMNQRLIPSILGFGSKYVSTTWSSLTLMLFDSPSLRDNEPRSRDNDLMNQT